MAVATAQSLTAEAPAARTVHQLSGRIDAIHTPSNIAEVVREQISRTIFLLHLGCLWTSIVKGSATFLTGEDKASTMGLEKITKMCRGACTVPARRTQAQGTARPGMTDTKAFRFDINA